jgi:AmmeMemoRadiSam system protein B
MELKPKLRDVEAHFVNQPGQQGVLLSDPLRLVDQAILLPMALAPLLELCDGTRDAAALRASLAVRAGVQIGPSTLEQVLEQMDEALLLDNEHFAVAYASALNDFRTAPFRAPASAGQTYPADPDELEATLESYLREAEQTGQPVAAPEGEIRGMVSPHIDYGRGGQVYAGVWHAAAEAIKEAELAILLGTDHIGGAKLTLTHQRYATPWGALPTASTIVDQVAQSVGPEVVFEKELHHLSEHSIELAVVWLHHMLGGRECQLVPVLCGGFEPFMEGSKSPAEDADLKAALHVLREAAASYKTIVVAAGDLAHVGPAFGDGYAIDFLEKARLKGHDEELLGALCRGDEDAFLQQIRDEGDRHRVCGLPPIYLALWLLGGAEGRVTGYAQCPADQQGASFVSVCGMVFS